MKGISNRKEIITIKLSLSSSGILVNCYAPDGASNG